MNDIKVKVVDMNENNTHFVTTGEPAYAVTTGEHSFAATTSEDEEEGEK